MAFGIASGSNTVTLAKVNATPQPGVVQVAAGTVYKRHIDFERHRAFEQDITSGNAIAVSVTIHATRAAASRSAALSEGRARESDWGGFIPAEQAQVIRERICS